MSESLGALTDTTSARPRPTIAVRMVVTHGDGVRRVDVEVGGSRSLVVEGEERTEVDTAELWTTLREVLPPLAHLRADPRGDSARADLRGTVPPTPALATECVAHVAVATVADDGTDAADHARVVVRTWLATPTDLWSATELADGTSEVVHEPPGALADLLVWDLAGATDALLDRLGATA